MRSIILAASAALCLTGCNTMKFDQGIQTSLAVVCPIAASAHAAFVVASQSPKLAKYVEKEAAGYSSLSVACIDPGSVNAYTLGAVIAAVYVAWEAAGIV